MFLIHKDKNQMHKIYNRLYTCFSFLIIMSIFSPMKVFAHNWIAPEQETVRKNPVQKTQISFNNGKELFTENCKSCHGETATGLKPKQTGLAKKTPDLLKRLKAHTEGDFHWKIKSGKSEMPSFNDILSDNEIWDIINYFNHLDQVRIK